MGYLLRMSDEIRDWLADLRDSDPVAARRVGEALTALITDGRILGPPLVVPLDKPPWSSSSADDLPEALDRTYAERLERLQALRRHGAEAATLARDIKRQVTELEAQVAELGDQRWRALQEGKPGAAAAAADELGAAQAKLAELQRLLPGVTDAAQELSRRSQREQARVDVLRTRKETLKATYYAALAQHGVHEALADWDAHVGAQAPDTEAVADVGEIIAEMERELPPRVSAEGLMELRPGAHGESDIRVLFAVEPPGTALLIAVLEGQDAVQEQRGEAVRLSAEVLQRVRAGDAPEAVARGFDDAASFLDEFFPGSADEVEAGAAALAAGYRARTLAERRALRGLTREQVAERMGVRPERVSAIERAEPGATEVRALASYVEALGGRLEIVADFGEERVALR